LFDQSIEHIKDARKNFQFGHYLKYGEILVSNESYQLVLIISLSLMPLERMFTVLAGNYTALLLASVQKLAFRGARPFFIDPHIDDISCKYMDYGMPSAHTFVGTVSYLITWAMLMDTWKCSSTIRHLTFWPLMLPLIIYVPISRVFAGSHSTD
jgi:hypothetical protein